MPAWVRESGGRVCIDLSKAPGWCSGSSCLRHRPSTGAAAGDRGRDRHAHTPRPAYDLPNPVATVNSEEIAHSGTTNLTDYLKRLPALTRLARRFSDQRLQHARPRTICPLSAASTCSICAILGYVRTLVLIDNHRTVSESTGSAAVDIDSIPISLVRSRRRRDRWRVRGLRRRRRVGRGQLHHEARSRGHPRQGPVRHFDRRRPAASTPRR